MNERTAQDGIGHQNRVQNRRGGMPVLPPAFFLVLCICNTSLGPPEKAEAAPPALRARAVALPLGDPFACALVMEDEGRDVRGRCGSAAAAGPRQPPGGC